MHLFPSDQLLHRNPAGFSHEKTLFGVPDFLRDKATKLLDHWEARQNLAAIANGLAAIETDGAHPGQM